MLRWKIEPLRLDLKYTWKISRNASEFKINSIIEVTDGTSSGKGEAAPNIRYNETPEKLLSDFARFEASVSKIKLADGPEALQQFVSLLDGLQLANALRFGIEQAFVHYLCSKSKRSIFELLGIPRPAPKATCYTLPIMEAGRMRSFFEENRLQRFAFIKIKVNAQSGFEDVTELSGICGQPIMVDGNEAWKNPDEVLEFIDGIKNLNIAFVEQPLPAKLNVEYEYLKTRSPLPLMADESVLATPDFDALQRQFHGINMKLMKAGGYLNGLRILREAQSRGMDTMIGCMVETTLGIWGAVSLSSFCHYLDVDGYMILKNEPFALVKEEQGLVSLTKEII